MAHRDIGISIGCPTLLRTSWTSLHRKPHYCRWVAGTVLTPNGKLAAKWKIYLDHSLSGSDTASPHNGLYPFTSASNCHGSMDWHVSHSLTTALNDALKTLGLTCFTIYDVRLTPKCPLRWWIVSIRGGSSCSTDVVHIASVSLRNASSYRWDTMAC